MEPEHIGGVGPPGLHGSVFAGARPCVLLRRPCSLRACGRLGDGLGGAQSWHWWSFPGCIRGTECKTLDHWGYFPVVIWLECVSLRVVRNKRRVWLCMDPAESREIPCVTKRPDRHKCHTFVVSYRPAIKVLHAMPTKRVLPDTISYSSVISACAPGLNFDIWFRMADTK